MDEVEVLSIKNNWFFYNYIIIIIENKHGSAKYSKVVLQDKFIK